MTLWPSTSRPFQVFQGLSRSCQAFQVRSGLEGLSRRPGQARGTRVSAPMVWPALKGGTSPGRWTPPGGGQSVVFRSSGHLGAFHFSIAFSMPSWVDLGSSFPPKSFQKSIPRCIVFAIDFWIDFLSMFARFWKPTWSHVGHFFAQNTATAKEPRVVFVGSICFFGFWAALAPSRPHFGSIWEGSGLAFGGCWCPCSLICSGLGNQLFQQC